MVNSSSFDAAGRGDRNAKAGCTQPHKASSSCDATQAASSCNSGFSSQTADESTPSQAEIDGAMAVIENNSEPCSDDNKSDEKTSLCCSLPLDKVQGVLAPFHQFRSEEDATTTSTITAAAKTKPTRKLLCLYCDRSFVSSNLRQKHVERIHSVKRNRRVSSRRQNQLTATPCVYCDKLNSTENTLKDLFRHLITEHSSKYFGCLPCEERFLSSSLLADHNASNHQTPISSDESSMSISTITESPTPEEDTIEESEIRDEEVSVKVTRSRMKPQQNPEESDKDKQIGTKKKSVKLKELRNKKLTVKSSKIALKRRESKRLQAIAKLCEPQKKKRPKSTEKKPVTVTSKPEQTNSTKLTEKAKPVSSCINPYPEFDSFYRVKKITDHSIDNLKISSLTFDDVFDKAFFNRIKCNIEENLLHHIDGKLFKNEESESRISNFEKVSNISQEIQNSASENYGCEISLNAVTPVASLSLNSQFGEDFESQIEYGSKPSKKKTQTKTDEVHYKYFTRRKYQASILEHKENRDLSKLDMWTQLVIKKRQQKMLDQKKTAKEILEYTTGDEYKSKMKKEELNRILDRRGPFEDLREEASKKAALDKLNSASEDSISHESFTEIQEVLNDILNRVFATTDNTDSTQETETDKSSNKKQDLREIPGHLELHRASSLPSEEEIDQSDRITLICSSQETENFELPTNQVRDKNELIELSGEWARRRMYICAACGAKLPNMKYLLDHKNIYHQNVWVQHYEFVGNQSDLYRHLCIPALGKVGVIEESVPYKVWRRSDARLCTKCGKQCNSLGELHRHILECGGDWTWMLARKKCKYKPFGAKSRRKRRGLVHRVHLKRKTEPTEKKKYKKPFEGPRQRPSDADTIQRMLANLPAKRSTRKLISLQDGIYRARKKTQINTQLSKNLNKKKVKCGKVIYQSSNLKENTEKTVNNRVKINNSTVTRRTLRSISTVLSSRIIDTNTKLTVRRKLKALNERRRTRQSQPVNIEEEVTKEENEKESSSETPATKTTPKNNTQKEVPEDVASSKRISPRSSPKNVKKITVKKLLTGKINIKSFFPVKKQKKIIPTEIQTIEDQPTNEENVENKTRSKKKLKEKDESKNEAPKTEEVKENNENGEVEEKKTKNNTFKKFVRSLSINKKKTVKKLNKETSVEKTKEIEDTTRKSDDCGISTGENLKAPIESTNKNVPINGKKRKLKNAVGNVLQKVKKLKTIHTTSESAKNDEKIKNKETNGKDSFLDKGKQNDKLDPPLLQDKIVIPSTLETKENIADITETVSIVSKTNEENPPIPETMFKLESSNEKSLQAKGELDFDTQPVTNINTITDTQEIENIEEEQHSVTEIKETEKLPEIMSEKMQPISIETSVKPKMVPLVSPNMKGKIHKPTRGLNDCIAMLTSKLQQKTSDNKPKIDGVLDLSPTGNISRSLTDLTLPKMDCILKIPTFKTHNVEETALDLSMKSRSNSSQKIENVFTNKSEVSFDRRKWKSPTIMSTIDQTIEDVIGRSILPLLPVKSQSTWNSIDETIQKVIDCYRDQTPEGTKGLNISRNSVDDIIDFVIKSWKKMNEINEEAPVLEEKILSKLISKKSKSKSAPNLLTEFTDNKIITSITASLSTVPQEQKVESDNIKNQESSTIVVANNQDPVKKKKRGRKRKNIASPEQTKHDALCEKDEKMSLQEKSAIVNELQPNIVEDKEIIPENTTEKPQEENETEETNKIIESVLNEGFITESKPVKITIGKNKKGPRKVGQVRNRSSTKRSKAKVQAEAPPVIETNVDNILNFEEIKTCEVSTSVATHISKDVIDQDIKLSNEDEPHLLENKVIIAEKKPSPQPSDSEDDLPLAALFKVDKKPAEVTTVEEEEETVIITDHQQDEGAMENMKITVETNKTLDITSQPSEKLEEDVETVAEELSKELEKSEICSIITNQEIETKSVNESGVSEANVLHVMNGQYKELIDNCNQNTSNDENIAKLQEESIANDADMVSPDDTYGQQNLSNGNSETVDILQENVEQIPKTKQRGRRKSRKIEAKQAICLEIVEKSPSTNADIPKSFNDSQNGSDYDQMSDISTDSSLSILEECSNSVMSSSETDGVFKTPLQRSRKTRKTKNKASTKRSKSLGDVSRIETMSCDNDENLLERSVSLSNITCNDIPDNSDSNIALKPSSDTNSISDVSIDNLQVQLMDINKSPIHFKTNMQINSKESEENSFVQETSADKFDMLPNDEDEEKETRSKKILEDSTIPDDSPVITKALDMLEPITFSEIPNVSENLRVTRKKSRSLMKSNSLTDMSESSTNSFLESSSDIDPSFNLFSEKFSDRTDSETADSSDYLSTQSTPQKPKRVGRKPKMRRNNQTRNQLKFQSKIETELVSKVLEDVSIPPVATETVDLVEEKNLQNKLDGNSVASEISAPEESESEKAITEPFLEFPKQVNSGRQVRKVGKKSKKGKSRIAVLNTLSQLSNEEPSITTNEDSVHFDQNNTLLNESEHLPKSYLECKTNTDDVKEPYEEAKPKENLTPTKSEIRSRSQKRNKSVEYSDSEVPIIEPESIYQTTPSVDESDSYRSLRTRNKTNTGPDNSKQLGTNTNIDDVNVSVPVVEKNSVGETLNLNLVAAVVKKPLRFKTNNPQRFNKKNVKQTEFDTIKEPESKGLNDDVSKTSHVNSTKELEAIQQDEQKDIVALSAPNVKLKKKVGRPRSKSKNQLNIISADPVVSSTAENLKPSDELKENNSAVKEILQTESLPSPVVSSVNTLYVQESNHQNISDVESSEDLVEGAKSAKFGTRKRKTKNKEIDSNISFDSLKAISTKTDEINQIVEDQSIRRPRSARNKQIIYTEINEVDDDDDDDDKEELLPAQNEIKKTARSRSDRKSVNVNESSELDNIDVPSSTLEVGRIEKPSAIPDRPRRSRSGRKISNIQQENTVDHIDDANNESNILVSAKETGNTTEIEKTETKTDEKCSEEDSSLKTNECPLIDEISDKIVPLENHIDDFDKTVTEDKKEPIKLIINKQKTRRKSKSFRKLGQNDLFKDFALVIKKPKRIQPIISFTCNENFMKNTYPNYLKKSEISPPVLLPCIEEIEKPTIDETELDASVEEMDMELDDEIPITSNIIERNDLSLPNINETVPSDDVPQKEETRPVGVTLKIKNKRITKRKPKIKTRKSASKHSKATQQQDKLEDNVEVNIDSLSDIFTEKDTLVEKVPEEIDISRSPDILQFNLEVKEHLNEINNIPEINSIAEKVEAVSDVDVLVAHAVKETSSLLKTPNKKGKTGKRKSKDAKNAEVDVKIAYSRCEESNINVNVDKIQKSSHKEENIQQKDIDSIYAFSESEDLEIEKPIVIPRRLPRKSNLSLEVKEKGHSQEVVHFNDNGNQIEQDVIEDKIHKEETLSNSPSLRRKSNVKKGQLKVTAAEIGLDLETKNLSENDDEEELPLKPTSKRKSKLKTDLTSLETKEVIGDPLEQEKLSMKSTLKRKSKHNKELTISPEFDAVKNEENVEMASKPALRRRSKVQKEETSDMIENKLELSNESVQLDKVFLKPNSRRKPKVTETIEKQELIIPPVLPDVSATTDVENLSEVSQNTVESEELPPLKPTPKQRSRFNKELTSNVSSVETGTPSDASDNYTKKGANSRRRSKLEKELVLGVSTSAESNSLTETLKNVIEPEEPSTKLTSRRKAKLSREVTLDAVAPKVNNDKSEASEKQEEELSLKPSLRRKSKVNKRGNANNSDLEEKVLLNVSENIQQSEEDIIKEKILPTKTVSRKKSKSSSEGNSDVPDLMSIGDIQLEAEKNTEELIEDESKILDNSVTTENDNQIDMQKPLEELVQSKPKKKSKFTREVTLDDIQENLSDGAIKENNAELEEGGRRKSMRSAKVKALEHIHDEALAELTESERNRDLDVPKIQIEENSTTDAANKKNATKKSKKSQKMQKLIDNFEFPKKILDEERSPLFDLVADIAGLEELENSIERELNAEINEKDEEETKYPEQELEFPSTNATNLDESASQDNQELRRSRRGSRKVTSYNENDLIDPLLDIIDGKKKNKRKEPSDRTPSCENKLTKKAAKEVEKKLNSEELFDLLKSSTSEQMYVPKTQNSFLNNLADSSRDFNVDDTFDNVFKNAQSTLLDQGTVADNCSQEQDVEKIYDFVENSESAEQEKMLSHLEKKKNNKTTSKRNRSPSKSVVDETLDSISDSREPMYEENPDYTKVNKSDSNYCDICNKSFIRIENLIKHKRTLTHIQKLSEIEAKEAEEKSKLEQVTNESNNDSESVSEVHPEISKASDLSESDINIHNILLDSEKPRSHSQMVHSSFTNNDSLKLADIISDVLNKPVMPNNKEEHGNFIPLQNNEMHQEFKRYKSLGERKSFDSDNVMSENRMLPSLTEPYISKTTILEKQISLLENIIESQTGVSYIDDISMSSNNSAVDNSEEYSSKNEKSVLKNDKQEPGSNEESFLKPTQYEEISEDSVNLRNYEDQKLRKTLNRDEELFLECCSLLKSGSEVSSYSNQRSQKVSNSLELKQYDEPESMEEKRITQSVEFGEDYSDDNSRIPTPLGDSYDDDASDSNTISSNWDIDKMAPVFDKEEKENSSSTFQEVLNTAVQNGKYRGASKIILRKTQVPKPEELDEEERKHKEVEDGATDFKKIITKGARKVFEGLKVSIPTEELNLDEVLNCSPKAKKLELSMQNAFGDIATTEPKDSPTKPRTSRKSKPVKKAQVGSNLLFKMNKKKVISPTLNAPSKKTKDDSIKSYDVYDFEETQDNTDVFTKPDFRTFRAKKSDENAEPESDTESRDGYLDSFVAERESVTSSVSSSSSLKKPKAQENITKKKCMIMGRIFKSQARSKLEDIDEEMREIPVLDNEELVENYVADCKKIIKIDVKPKLSEKEINQLFDQLLENKNTDKEGANSTVTKTTTKSKQEIKKGASSNKKKKVKNRKRTRTNSDSTDDEFSLNKTMKRSYKKNGKAEDNCINLEQELKECIGVASRKSQRKCTSGKQNVLVEYWSSDDSQFEALLESQRIDIKPKQQNIVTEKIIEEDDEEVAAIPGEEENIIESIAEEKVVHTVKASKPKNPEKKVQHRKKSVGEKKEKSQNSETDKLDTVTVNRRKRAAANPLYHWSSSSEDESHDLIEVKPLRDELDDEEDRPIQHGWIVGDSPKKLVTMLAQAKGKKTDIDCVKEQGKKRTNAVS